jgi:hypothetical protein
MKKYRHNLPNLYMPHLNANKRNNIQVMIIVFLPHQDEFVDELSLLLVSGKRMRMGQAHPS